MLNTSERSVAMGRAYALFAEVLLYGIKPHLIPILNILPALPQLDGALCDDYAAQHYQLFGHNVFPYAAVVLSDDGLLGGTVTESAIQWYARIGYAPDSGESPDHIGVALGALAFLCAAEADAIQDDAAIQVNRMRNLQRRFLDSYVLRWLPALTYAVQQQGDGIYQAVMTNVLALVLDHRATLGDDLLAPPPALNLPNPPDLIGHDKTGLRDITRFLLTPAHCGFFLSQDDITRLGARMRLPHGFGKRQQTLGNLLKVAADYDLFDDLLAAITQICDDWYTLYKQTDALPDAIRQVWLQRLEATSHTLNTLRQMAAHAPFADDSIDAAQVAQGGASTGCAVDNEDNHDNTPC